MDVPVCDSLRHESVILESRDAQSGSVFLEADDNKLVATQGMRGFTSIFEIISASDEDGQLVALQVDNKYFLTPKKPKDSSRDSYLKLIPKEIERSKIFDKKDSEIAHENRKYWFRVKTVGDAQVYESLAYPGFYVSVEGKEVLMRKCSGNLPDDPNYHIYVMPPSDKRRIKMYAVSNKTTLQSGFGEHGACGTLHLSTEEHTEANVTTDVTLKHTEAGITSDIITAKTESSERLQQSCLDKGELTRTSDTLEVRSEIDTLCSSKYGNILVCQEAEVNVITISSLTDDYTKQGEAETKTKKEDITPRN